MQMHLMRVGARPREHGCFPRVAESICSWLEKRFEFVRKDGHKKVFLESLEKLFLSILLAIILVSSLRLIQLVHFL